MKVNMTPNPLDVVTIHASQGDSEARQWEFELHNNGELIDTSEITEQLFFKAYKGGTEQILPENTSTPTTSPFIGDIKYPDATRTDQEFTYRQSPTESDGNAKITDIKGNTLVWNQLVPLNAIRASGEVTPNRGLSYTNNNDGSITLSGTATENGFASFYFIADNVLPCIQGHKYLTDANNRIFGSGTITDSGHGFTATSNGYMRLWARIPVVANTVYNLTYYPQIYDLTQMFGSSKADEIYAMEQAQAGTGVAYFKSLFPLPYYHYDAGSLLFFNGNGIKTTGKNKLLFANGTRTGTGITGTVSDGVFSATGTATSTYANLNFFNTIDFIENDKQYTVGLNAPIGYSIVFRFATDTTGTTYQQVTVSANSQFTTFTANNDFKYVRLYITSLTSGTVVNISNMIPIIANGQIDTFEPYHTETTTLPISTYFPTGMKSAGSVYDELTESKAITRIGVVDLGSLTWFSAGTSGSEMRMYTDGIKDIVKPSTSTNTKGNLVCAKYVNDTGDATYTKNTCIAVIQTGRIFVYDPNYNTSSSPSAFKTAMSGVYLYYELATPTETSFTTASLVTENTEIPLSNEDGVLIGKCTEQLSENPGFIDAKIKLTDSDGECYSNKIQLHVERSPQ